MHSGMPSAPAAGSIGPAPAQSAGTQYAGYPPQLPTQPQYTRGPTSTPYPQASAQPAYSYNGLPPVSNQFLPPPVPNAYNPSSYYTRPTTNIINGRVVSNSNQSVQPGVIYSGNAYAGQAVPAVSVPQPVMQTQSAAKSVLANNAVAAPPPQERQHVSRKSPREEKEFYEVEFENGCLAFSVLSRLVVKRLAGNEILEPVFEVCKSDYYGKLPALVVVSNRRLLLITEDRRGGVYWSLETTEATKVEEASLIKNCKFFFKSTVENSKEHYVEFTDKKAAGVLDALFRANKTFHEYDTVYIKNRLNVLAVFNEECDTVIRFSNALSLCSHNPTAMFSWLLSMDSVLPLVKRQLRAAANEWAKSTMGTTSVEDFEMLDVIQQGSDEETYYKQLASQIASFLMRGSLMKTYCGAIPLLDAYYFYGKATANDLKSPGLEIRGE